MLAKAALLKASRESPPIITPIVVGQHDILISPPMAAIHDDPDDLTLSLPPRALITGQRPQPGPLSDSPLSSFSGLFTPDFTPGTSAMMKMVMQSLQGDSPCLAFTSPQPHVDGEGGKPHHTITAVHITEEQPGLVSTMTEQPMSAKPKRAKKEAMTHAVTPSVTLTDDSHSHTSSPCGKLSRKERNRIASEKLRVKKMNAEATLTQELHVLRDEKSALEAELLVLECQITAIKTRSSEGAK